MKTHTIHLRDSGTDLSGRSLAKSLRVQGARLANAGTRVVFDFTGVICASDSFLDELLAVLVASRGAAWFKTWVHVEGLAPEIRRDLLAAIDTRLGRTVASESKRPSVPA